MAVTLSREEYVRFKALGEPDEYPKSTTLAGAELRVRGYDATEERLNYLVKQGRVRPKREGRVYGWRERDIDQAAALLDEALAYGPEAQLNRLLDLDFGQREEALHAAWAKLAEEFPGQLPAKPVLDYFVLHIHPPRLTRLGQVEYVLCQDVRRELEARQAAQRR